MGQTKPPLIPTSLDLSGKIVIVTGADTGMGLESARQYLVLHAARVILTVRTLSKGEAAATYLSDHPTVKESIPTTEIIVVELDLDDYQSVFKFTEAVKEKFDAVDMVLLNGGFNLMNYQTSKSGHERVMQVNYNFEAMLALELLPLLEATATNSKMASTTKKPIPENEDLIARFDNKDTYSGMLRYSDSKLLASAFIQEFTKRISGTKVIANHLKPFVFVFEKKIRAKDAAEGAKMLIFSSAVIGQESHGQFIANNRITSPNATLAEPAGITFKKKLWKETVADVSKVDPKVASLLSLE
ncbi:hypothetical protein MMC30_009388 [Trapelia coarctata]|nr:hypothetical protein [Trapelia coarctata]